MRQAATHVMHQPLHNAMHPAALYVAFPNPNPDPNPNPSPHHMPPEAVGVGEALRVCALLLFDEHALLGVWVRVWIRVRVKVRVRVRVGVIG